MEMGRSLETHRGTFSAGGWYWYLGGMGVVAGLLGLAGVSGSGAAKSFAERAPTAGAALAIGLVLLITPISRFKQSVEVFERGLIWKRLYGAVAITADQVRGVQWIQHRGRQSSYHEVKVQLTSGKQYSITGIAQAEQLVNFLRSWSAPTPVASPAANWSPPAGSEATSNPGSWKPPGT